MGVLLGRGRVMSEMGQDLPRLIAGGGRSVQLMATCLADAFFDDGALRGYVDPLLRSFVESGFGPDFRIETEFSRARIDDYDFGITRAVAAIAETGTLVLDDARTSSRLGALAPWIHVAVVRRKEFHPHVAAAIAALGSDPGVVWVTGPSKTADVEGILIEASTARVNRWRSSSTAESARVTNRPPRVQHY